MARSLLSGVFNQEPFAVALEWGALGAQVLAPSVDVLIIVDVLSFTTAVDIAAARGATVFPYRRRDATAITFASQVEAVLAVERRQVSVQHPFSLSPTTLVDIPPGTRLVLPSPNGSTISVVAANLCRTVLAGCLRNAAAVADRAREVGGRVGVIASGERWPDGSLRPAFEDLVGAGAIIGHLSPSGWSPEAEASVCVFQRSAAKLKAQLHACVSGRELAAMGFAGDVDIASALNESKTVPVFSDGAYAAA